MSLALAPDLSVWVSANQERLIDDWQECCRVRSVSAEGAAGPCAMAEWLTARARPLFDRYDVFDVPDGGPVLLGTLDGTGPGRLLLYSHYDVVPPGPGWSVDPFAAGIRDGAMYARGSGDDKADVTARLHAIEAWMSVRGRLPFTTIWLSEGMEEIGSPGLASVIDAHPQHFAADACLWESYFRSIDGNAATVGFGSRGVLNVALRVRMLDADTHSTMAGVLRSAAAILTRAIASLVDGEGRVLIPGFYDSVRPLTAADEHVLVRSSPPQVEDTTVARGARWTDDRREMTRRWLYEPTFNIASLHAGPPPGADQATVLPAAAEARLDIRLMPDQEPTVILQHLRAHLHAEGFPEVDVTVLSAIPPAASSIDSPLARVVRQVATEMFDGAEPVLHPVVPGSGPLHLFTKQAVPAAVMPPGTIRPDSGMHGPDENVIVDQYVELVRSNLRTFELLAELPRLDEDATKGAE